ncbi:hypothetical protein V3C99_009519 [Haemonchus contortus]
MYLLFTLLALCTIVATAPLMDEEAVDEVHHEGLQKSVHLFEPGFSPYVYSPVRFILQLLECDLLAHLTCDLLARITEKMLLYLLIALIPPSIMVDGYLYYLEDTYGACSPWIYVAKYKKCYKKFCDNRWYDDHEHLCSRLNGHMVTICSHHENHIVSMLSRFHNRLGGDGGITDHNTFTGLRWDRGWRWHSWKKGCIFRRWSGKYGEPKSLFVNVAGLYTAYRDVYDEWSTNVAAFKSGKVICEIENCTTAMMGI